MKFLLLAGSHVDERGMSHTFVKGKKTYVESDIDLEHLFVNKFERDDDVRDRADPGTHVAAPTMPQEPAPRPAASPERATAESVEEQPLGEDVTAKFPDAEAKGLRVFKSGRKYAVTDGSDATKQLDDGDLTTIDGVTEFVGRRRKRH